MYAPKLNHKAIVNPAHKPAMAPAVFVNGNTHARTKTPITGALKAPLKSN